MSMTTRANALAARPSLSIVALQASLLGVFVALVIFLRAFKPEEAGFERSGPLLILYHVSRVGLVGFIAILCYTAGYRAMELLRLAPLGLFTSARRAAILCFFFGASLYGATFAALGLAGLITLTSGMVLTLPVLALSYRPLVVLMALLQADEVTRPLPDPYTRAWLVRTVIVIAGGAAVFFLLTRLVYLAVFDPNIWEHYVHYYRAVLATGSTQPNDVWHHFYASKGAGLILLTNVLSDFFGAQIVSACFVLMAGVIVLDLLLEHCRSASWAFFGVVLFLAFLYGQVSDGATFKHHGVIVGYAALALWGSVWLPRVPPLHFRTFMIVLVVALAYLGFYLPGVTPVFVAAFVLVALIHAARSQAREVSASLILAGALCGGTAVALLTNWVLTGLLEVTPMRWLWAIADQAKVERVFGTGGVEFFLAMNNDLRPEYDWSLRRAWKVLRYPLPPLVTYVSLVAVLVLALLKQARKPGDETIRLLAYIAAFLVPLSIFAQAVQTVAVDRMALYSIVFTTVATTVLLKRLVDTSLGVKISIVRAAASGAPGEARKGIEVWRVASAFVIAVGVVVAVIEGWEDIGRKQRAVLFPFISGGLSLKEAFHKVEAGLRYPKIGMTVTAMSEFREKLGPHDRMLRVTYDAGFSYALPGDGVVSEPTYALIRNRSTMLASAPGEVVDYLKRRGISYLALNLQSSLFSTIAFTSLFDPREAPKYLGVVYEDRDFFILTWRDQEPTRPLPEYLLTLLELKRSGVLNYPFTKRFDDRVRRTGNRLVDSGAAFYDVRQKFLDDLDDAMRTEMLSAVSRETSRAVLHRMVDAATQELADLEPDLAPVSRLRRLLDAQAQSGHELLAERISERELSVRFVRRFRETLYQEYVAELGAEVASLSLRCDERMPFAMTYPPGATCM